MSVRVKRFAAVGAFGFAMQISVLWGLTAIGGWPYTSATVLAVELAVLHNFWWHDRWTWRDRAAGRPGAVARLARFHLTVGIASIAGNVIFTAACVELLGIAAPVANIAAVGLTSAANYLAADRWVFARSPAVTLECRDGDSRRRETLAHRRRERVSARGVAVNAQRLDLDRQH